MNTDELYGALSARITAAVTGYETENWAAYFEGLRAIVRRVVNDKLASQVVVEIERSAGYAERIITRSIDRAGRE
jgi:hypothetical protein